MNYTIINYIFTEHSIDKPKPIADAQHFKDKNLKEKRISLVQEGEHTQSEFRNDVIDETSFKNFAGRKWKNNLEAMITFINIYKYSFARKELFSLPISCTNRTLLNLFGNERQVSRLLEMAQKVDLLKCTDEHYQFNAYNEQLNFSKRYICNKNVQDLIIKLAKQYEIKPKKNRNFKHFESIEDADLNVSFNSKLRLPNIDDDVVEALLQKRYAQLSTYQQMVDELNDKYYNDERSISFTPNITHSNGENLYITKIGIRAYNSICSTKVHNITEENEENMTTRKDWLDDHYGKDNWLKFDVKSSIFRINYFLNTGKWLSNDIDIYELMYGKKFDSPEQRDAYKKFAMKLYFEKSIDTHYVHLIRDNPTVKNFDVDEVKKAIGEAKEQMLKVIGKTYDSEIFLHESCIYLDVQKELLERGHDVTVVYDCFYIDKSMTLEQFEKECCNIIENKAKAYREKYIMK